MEENGPSAIKPFIDKHLRPGSKRSWPETRKNLEIYLERAVLMIDQATLVYGIEFFRDRIFYVFSSKYILERAAENQQQRKHIGYPIRRSPGIKVDGSSSRSRIYSRRKISTPADQKSFFLTTRNSLVFADSAHSPQHSAGYPEVWQM